MLKANTYQTKKFSPFRKASTDLLTAANKKNMVHALVEADITETRKAIKYARKNQNQHVSLLGFILCSTANALDSYKEMQAYRDWRNRLIIFDDVDISTTIERKINDNYEVIPTIVRKANQKSIFEISEEIKKAKIAPVNDTEVYKAIKYYLSIPVFLRRLAFKLLDRFPLLMKKKAGTIMITSANAVRMGTVWGIPVASHTLNITIGGIKQAQGYLNNKLVTQEYLCLTISFDHNIIDGAPASRFIRHLLKYLENNSIINNKKK